MASFDATPIMWAARAGEVKKVRKLLSKEPSLLDATHGYFKQSPLMEASREGKVEVVRLLLEAGAEKDLRDAEGKTAMYMAALGGHAEVVAALLQAGADAGIKGADGWTPLMRAAHRGHVEIVKSLLRQEGSRRYVDESNENGETALWWACHYGRTEVVRALLVEGLAKRSVVSSQGKTARDMAVQFSHRAIVQLLEWFERETERPYVLYRARRLHHYGAARRDPAAPVPPYMAERVSTGAELPGLLPLVEEQQQQGGGTGSSKSKGGAAGGPVAAWAGGVSSPKQQQQQQQREEGERAATVNFVVKQLGEGMFADLMDGLMLR